MSLDRINQLRYGFGFMGNNKTFKARYKAQHADLIIKQIPQQHQVLLISYKTQQDYKFIGLVAHPTHIIWVMFERAVIRARAEMVEE